MPQINSRDMEPSPVMSASMGEEEAMKRIQLEYLFEDKPYVEGDTLPDYGLLDVVSHGCHLYGEILWPDGARPRPCVILFHGFPGSARNDDLAHALCRVGCVVLTPHHRGAWGSEGEYLVSNCVEDAVILANYVRRAEFVRQYHADPDNIYLIGHSMGGNTVLHAARELPWLRGIVLLTPFDPTRHLRDGREDLLLRLLEQGTPLRSRGVDGMLRDIVSHQESFCFASAFEDLRDQNLLCITGKSDQCAPAEQMFLPLWEKLQAYGSGAVQRFLELPAGHGLLGCRSALIQAVAQFLADTLCEHQFQS